MNFRQLYIVSLTRLLNVVLLYHIEAIGVQVQFGLYIVLYIRETLEELTSIKYSYGVVV